MKYYKLMATSSSKNELKDVEYIIDLLRTDEISIENRSSASSDERGFIEGIVISEWVISGVSGIGIGVIANSIYDELKSLISNDDENVIKREKTSKIEIINKKTGMRLVIEEKEKEERKK